MEAISAQGTQKLNFQELCVLILNNKTLSNIKK